MIKIKKGLNLPMTGEPRKQIKQVTINTLGLVGDDYLDLKPKFLVKAGDLVRRGQPLFFDQSMPRVLFTAPAAGHIAAIHRGERRRFEVLEIHRDREESVSFPRYRLSDLPSLPRTTLVEQLLTAGLWPSLRTRPYNKIPAPESEPHSIFVTLMDSHPLAPDVATVIHGNTEDLHWGLIILRGLTQGKVFVCKSPDLELALPPEVTVQNFAGPHPAGLAGTHIHFLDPVGLQKTVWFCGYQDVMAIGHLFRQGLYQSERVISVAGPAVRDPHHARVPLGANLMEITSGQLHEGDVRVISGSVYNGRRLQGTEAFLGRYHQQVVALHEGREREFLGWQMPGLNKFSVKRVFASLLRPGKKYPLTTTTGGSPRAMVPIGSYEQVMPLDIEATFLLRSLLIGDSESAQQLGALELDEDDVGLLTFVCPTKADYATLLRHCLRIIEKEG
ncbi:Na(+)-translocating NADH-quinone reductase subunit A [Oligoflexus tunisiensis]|uniref:Na(+)-translocating NADH-quinone reductase subunit A n=1 Tax=Oligoflexus tunisiensis TaxID=708132 RepID=UPI000A63CD1F|nr:Na(+)-translocating NADH-quinone reductase subunit A [Oligoflexus tunisiensis]